jgi:ABC-type multidrug transport system ATPase subunit
MLTGVHAATGGTAHIFGHDVRTKSGMDEIRKTMGVCPQHDILWPDLTAREHLRLFCGLKNIPDSLVEAEVEERLADVQLTPWGDAPSMSYSGGMKRRLSVAIALIGSPKIVFLDEPTTGMDPVSRRQVWDLIERVKKGRVIVNNTFYGRS